jgi:GNAT superfamily N-acetyltransferase
MNIRQANIHDVASLAPLFDAYRVFYGKDSELGAAARFLKDRLTNNESQIYIAVADNHVMTGFTQLYPLFSSTRMKRLWLLNDLFVDPRFRGLGISKLLIDAAKELCTNTDSCGLILETAKSNLIGNHLYPATGFSLDRDHNYYSWDI